MQHFTPVSAFFGELLIGLDAVVLMLFPSRIAGIAVIVGGLLGFDCREIVWRGGIRPWFDRGPAIGRLGAGRALPAVTVDALPPVVVVLAAFSSTLARGSTAGVPAAGVCGLGRLSARSLVATLALSCLREVPRSQCWSRCIAREIDETNEKGCAFPSLCWGQSS